MKNKIELKKTLILIGTIIFISLIMIQFLLLYEYKIYTKNFNQKIETIAGIVVNKYPNIDRNELIEILNSEDELEQNLLQQYGINLEKESVIIKNDRIFTKFLVVDICFIICSFGCVLLIFLKYNSKKDKEIAEITKYIEEINNKNYKLYIEDNTEDELSILKNEIYKTTIMLKEMAENSKEDKINLKKSISDISHQLKTPLASMSVMLDNILDNPQMKETDRNAFIKDIRREVININFLVSSLLKLSKLDANSVNFIKSNFNLEDIINNAIKNVATICDLKNINILVNNNEKIEIECDFKWQVEAITNILKNCVEHSKENSKIDIYLEKNNIYSEIKIRDYGTGISKKDLPHIFERFYKGENSSSESIGIGLALAKSIIENEKGYIYVESEVGEGTEFLIKYFK